MRFLCLFALLGVSLGDQVVLNQVVDQLIAGINQQVAAAGKDTVHFEDMNHDWKYRWHFVKLSGHVNCHDGYAKSLATFRRTGDVVMATNGNAITLKGSLGFGTLEFGFERCQLKANHLLSTTTHVGASVDSNSIQGLVTFTKIGNQCIANVDSIGLNVLGKIKLKTGGSVLHKIEDKLLNCMTRHLHSKVKDSINRALVDGAKANVNKLNLCDKIPHQMETLVLNF